jgi:hypothetical protein
MAYPATMCNLFSDDHIQIGRGDLGSQGAPNLLNCPNTVTGILAVFWDMPLSKMKPQCVKLLWGMACPIVHSHGLGSAEISQLSVSFPRECERHLCMKSLV